MDEMDSPTAGIDAWLPYLNGGMHDDPADIPTTPGLDRQEMLVRDGRNCEDRPSLDYEGFELFLWPSDTVRISLSALTVPHRPEDIPDVVHRYWADTVPLIRATSNAREVYPLHDSALRFSRRAKRDRSMTPAGWVHLDYDAREAEAQMKAALAREGVEAAPFSRFILFQGWRVLSPPPQDCPLALCDARTVGMGDIVPVRFRDKTDLGEVIRDGRGSRHNAGHEWWYFPDMTSDEMILFKGYDSEWQDGMQTLHVAFEDESIERPHPRISIETRYVALFD